MNKIFTLALVVMMAIFIAGALYAQSTPATTKPTPTTTTTPATATTKETPAPAKTETPKAAPVKLHQFTGLVSAVDVVANTITVANNKTTETFNVDPSCKIRMKKEYKLGEVPKDSKVLVSYKEDAGKKVATKIQIIKLAKAASKSK